MSARHHNTRAETARLDTLVLGAFEAGASFKAEDIHERIGRRNIDGHSLSTTLSRLRRAGKLAHDRKTGWSLLTPAPTYAEQYNAVMAEGDTASMGIDPRAPLYTNDTTRGLNGMRRRPIIDDEDVAESEEFIT